MKQDQICLQNQYLTGRQRKLDNILYEIVFSLNTLFGFDKTDASNVNKISGPETLVQKVKQVLQYVAYQQRNNKQQNRKEKLQNKPNKLIVYLPI